jgi:hypothetical protein
MTFIDFFLIQLVIILGIGLIVVGLTGVISSSAVINHFPLSLNRPMIYLLLAGLIFAQPIIDRYGPLSMRIVFTLLIFGVAYDVASSLFSRTLKVIGASPAMIDADLRDAFQKMNLKVSGTYPHYELEEPRASVDVKFWRHLGQAEIGVTPESERRILRRIEEIVDKDLGREEQVAAGRGFILEILAGAALCGLAIWQLIKFTTI